MNWLGDLLIKRGVDREDRILDLGCGLIQATGVLGPRHLCVDAFQPAIERLTRVDAMTMLGVLPEVLEHFTLNSWDVVLLLDVVEHMEKEAAWETIDQCEGIAIKQVVVFTPEGFVKQDAFKDDGLPENPFQEHRCGFTEREFSDRGYMTTIHPNRSLCAGEFPAILAIKEMR